MDINQTLIVKSYSPLRYPGGKAMLSNFLRDIAVQNNLVGGTYCELYGGGGGAALNMLFSNTFSKIHINDADYHIFQIWESILHNTEEFISKIENAKLDITEWKRQKEVFSNKSAYSKIENAFSAFFLNRTNRSGIIFNAGPIGGNNQNGNYLLGVRFNKKDLIKRVEKIAENKDNISISNLDAIQILKNFDNIFPDISKLFLYLDPPYYVKGKTLYLNNYSHIDHKNLAELMSKIKFNNWLISYDYVSEIEKMYVDFRKSTFSIKYTLQEKKIASELLVFGNKLNIPSNIKLGKMNENLIFI
jgi:DNA adenine methylase